VKKSSIGSVGSQKTPLSQGHLPRLTRVEKEILVFLQDDFLTPLQIALRRGCSVSAVHKIIRSIRCKGYVGNMVHRVQNSDPTCEPYIKEGVGSVRLHGQHFVLQLIESPSLRYVEARAKRNIEYVNGHTVKLHRRAVEVIAGSGVSFFGEDAASVTAQSMVYWTTFFQRLESNLGVLLVKFRAQNVRQVSAHYALIRNGLARDCRLRGDKIRVYAREDGKLWFTIDNSFNLDEAETLHPDTGELDMQQAVQPFFNDLRERAGHSGEIVTLSEIMLVLKEQARVNGETAAGLNAVVQLLRPSSFELERPPRGPSRPDYVG
jgi:DNA-binding CsgD family transcriptional regulator